MTDEILDYDTVSEIFNIKQERYEPRYKHIKNENDLKINDYVTDFKLLPTSLVFSFDNSEDQIAILNKLTTDCIAGHAPIKKVKFTCPPDP